MMIGTEYKVAASETLSVLENINSIDIKKIPQSFLDFLAELSSKEDRPELDYSKPIEELNHKDKMIKNKRKNNNVGTNVKYEVDDIFKTRKNNVLVNNTENTEIKEMVEYKEETFIKKIINKILSFFNKGLRR